MVRKWILMVLVVIAGVFVLQNIQVVTVRLLLWQLSMSGVFLYLFLFLIGAGVGYLWCHMRQH